MRKNLALFLASLVLAIALPAFAAAPQSSPAPVKRDVPPTIAAAMAKNDKAKPVAKATKPKAKKAKASKKKAKTVAKKK